MMYPQPTEEEYDLALLGAKRDWMIHCYEFGIDPGDEQVKFKPFIEDLLEATRKGGER